MLVQAATAIIAAFLVLQGRPLASNASSSTHGIALLWSLITHPDLNIVFQSTTSVLLDLLYVNLQISLDTCNAPERRHFTSPIPLLDILHGPYCKSLNLIKPVLKPAVPFNAGLTFDSHRHLSTGVLGHGNINVCNLFDNN